MNSWPHLTELCSTSLTITSPGKKSCNQSAASKFSPETTYRNTCSVCAYARKNATQTAQFYQGMTPPWNLTNLSTRNQISSGSQTGILLVRRAQGKPHSPRHVQYPGHSKAAVVVEGDGVPEHGLPKGLGGVAPKLSGGKTHRATQGAVI